MKISVDNSLDVKGLTCPLPVVQTKKALEKMEPGQVLEVEATDAGSLADIRAWATGVGHQFLGTIEEEGLIKHYIRKASPREMKDNPKHLQVIDLEILKQKVENNEPLIIIDVREPAEYAFGHIPGAKSIPLDRLEEQLAEFNKDDEIFLVCRTGNRSDFAAQLMAERGFTRVKNVVPGMTSWTGPIEKQV